MRFANIENKRILIMKVIRGILLIKTNK